MIAIAASAAILRSTSFAERTETLLDGNDWTLDGLPVLVPNTWNKIDASDGSPGTPFTPRNFGNTIPLATYARRRGVYARNLPDAKDGRRYFIRCEGASQKADVCVNGVALGSHKGAYSAFTFEATKAMKPSGNRLEIEVSNEFDKTIPPIHGDYTVCGGLYRSVWLIETDPVCIDPTIDGGPGVRVFPSMDGSVRVEADVSGADDATVDWEPKKVAAPRLWTPESPSVYEVRVTVRKGAWSDTVVQPFGFRTAEIRDDGFYLNGVKRKVRGVSRHQDLEGKGWEISSAEERRDMRLIKTMGADALRLAVYQQSDNVYSLCDRMGVMVWTEIPVFGIGLENPEFVENAKRMLREMIAQTRNHPSVCWWSIWNELWERHDAAYAAPANELSALARKLDPSRPTVAASCYPKLKLLNASVQRICLNTYPGWYARKTMRETVDDFIAGNGLKTLAISEYGAGASIFHHQNPPSRPKTVSWFHPEEWQTKVHIDDYRAIVADDRIWGAFIWVMFDFGADARREGDRHGVNDKGLVTRDRVTAKDAYFLYKANWNPEPMLHLCGKRMVQTENAAVCVTAFSNVGDVTLSVNGEAVGTKSPDEIRIVTFDGVKLRPGANDISVKAGELGDACVWRLDVPAAPEK